MLVLQAHHYIGVNLMFYQSGQQALYKKMSSLFVDQH